MNITIEFINKLQNCFILGNNRVVEVFFTHCSWSKNGMKQHKI